MRFTRIHITQWRNFRNVTIEPPSETKLICLVGENGTGKSSLFELIAALSHHFGLAPGVDAPRGQPFTEKHHIAAEFTFSQGANWVFDGLPNADASLSAVTGWNGTLELLSVIDESGVQSTTITAGGTTTDPIQAARLIVNAVRQKQQILYLAIDADRAYPQIGINAQNLASEVIAQGTSDDVIARQLKGKSHQRSSSMYSDWEQNVLARRYKAAKQHYEASVIAARQQNGQPVPRDPDDHYREQLRAVLPHLHFVGASIDTNSLEFDSAGTPLRFWQLSGGEREVAFIIGQIERFGLKNGLLLIDEPELHLNPDLVRQWVSFLRENVEDGQVWIATHSMEAVEAAGTDSTYVLMREPESRLVTSTPRLSGKPIISTLSAALGTPGFSLTSLAFIFVEGEPHTNEVQRFFALNGGTSEARFIPGGSCHDVIRKVQHVNELAVAAEDQLHVGAIIDRDFRSQSDIQAITAKTNCFILPCHEVENLFLHPPSLDELIRQNNTTLQGSDLVRSTADKMAGQWILQRSLYATDFGRTLCNGLEVPRMARELAGKSEWISIDGNQSAFVSALSSMLTKAPAEAATLQAAILDSVSEWRRIRMKSDLWKWCLGKETLAQIYRPVGYITSGALESSMVAAWRRRSDLISSEVADLRAYVSSLLT